MPDLFSPPKKIFYDALLKNLGCCSTLLKNAYASGGVKVICPQSWGQKQNGYKNSNVKKSLPKQINKRSEISSFTVDTKNPQVKN